MNGESKQTQQIIKLLFVSDQKKLDSAGLCLVIIQKDARSDAVRDDVGVSSIAEVERFGE